LFIIDRLGLFEGGDRTGGRCVDMP
jgi:hypothetical protein